MPHLICGPDCSGRTSLLLSALAAATRREEICALIDASDAFASALGRGRRHQLGNASLDSL